MRLKVKKGAVITLLLNFQSNYNFEGAVVSIDDNEVVLQPQWFVAKENVGYLHGFIEYPDICQDFTMDSPYPEIHIGRKNIIGWTYKKIPCEEIGSHTAYAGFYVWKQQEPSKMHFYKNGICEGSGEPLD